MLGIIRRTHAASIARSAVFLLLVLSAAGGLLALGPAVRYYATAQYDYARFTYQVNGSFDHAALARLRALSDWGQLASFLTVRPASVRTAGVTDSSVTLLLVDPGSRLDASWFTDGTLVASRPVTDSWIDLSTTLAARLGVHPGDRVSVPLTSGSVEGTVRSLYALTFMSVESVAVIPRTPAVDALLPEVRGTSTWATVVTSASRQAVAEAGTNASTYPGKAQIAADVRTRAEARALGAGNGEIHGDGGRTLGMLGLLVFVAVAVREGHALVTRRADTLAVAVAVGASRRSVLAALMFWEVVAVVLVGLGIGWLIRDVAFGSVWPIIWPPRLDPLLASGVAVTLAAYLCAVLSIGLVKFSYPSLLATLREGRSM